MIIDWGELNHIQLWCLTQPEATLICKPPVCLPEGVLHHLKAYKNGRGTQDQFGNMLLT